MSSVVIVQKHNEVFVGADSAISANIQGKSFRVSNTGKKLFQVDDFLIFCSGNLDLSYTIMREFEDLEIKGVNSLRHIAEKTHLSFIEQGQIKKDEFNLDIVVVTNINGASKVFQISPYNDFEIVERVVNKGETAIWTGGMRVKDSLDLMYVNLINHNGILNSYKKTFESLSCEEIGGYLTLYKVAETPKKVNLLNIFKIQEDIDPMELENVTTESLSLVVAERLMGKVIMGENLFIGDDDGTFEIKGNILTIKDRQDIVRLLLGEYEENKFGLKLMNKTGQDVILDENGILQSWQEGRADNVDASNGLSMNVYFPEDTLSIRRVLLNFKLLPFRSYSKATASAGSTQLTSSSGGGNSATSTSGGGTTATSSSGGGVSTSTNSGGGTTQTSNAGGDHSHKMFSATGFVAASDPNNSVALRAANGQYIYVDSDTAAGISYYTEGTSGNHSHSVSVPSHSHDFSVPNHSHSVTIPNHSHTVNIPDHTHSVNIPAHTHDQVHGIYTGTTASNVSVWINGINRTIELGGKFNTDQTNLSIGQYLNIGQWNEIKLTSESLGRLDAHVFLQAFLGT